MSRVYRGLHTRKTIMGMDRGLFAILISVWMYVVVFSPFSFPVKVTISLGFFSLYIWLRVQNKREPDLVKIYVRYSKQADRYEPWPDWMPKRNWRPVGFGDTKILK